jgi:hypothetical protein
VISSGVFDIDDMSFRREACSARPPQEAGLNVSNPSGGFAGYEVEIASKRAFCCVCGF